MVDIEELTGTEQVRVMKNTDVGGSTNTILFFEGSLDLLDDDYPYSDVMGADPLDRCEIEDGHIIMTYSFKIMQDGEWVNIEDPRAEPENGVMTELEKAIDADNRRDFPGDYI